MITAEMYATLQAIETRAELTPAQASLLPVMSAQELIQATGTDYGWRVTAKAFEEARERRRGQNTTAQGFRKLAADLRKQADVAEQIALELDVAAGRFEHMDLTPPKRVKHVALAVTAWGEIRTPCTCELGVNHTAPVPKMLR